MPPELSRPVVGPMKYIRNIINVRLHIIQILYYVVPYVPGPVINVLATLVNVSRPFFGGVEAIRQPISPPIINIPPLRLIYNASPLHAIPKTLCDVSYIQLTLNALH